MHIGIDETSGGADACQTDAGEQEDLEQQQNDACNEQCDDDEDVHFF